MGFIFSKPHSVHTLLLHWQYFLALVFGFGRKIPITSCFQGGQDSTVFLALLFFIVFFSTIFPFNNDRAVKRKVKKEAPVFFVLFFSGDLCIGKLLFYTQGGFIWSQIACTPSCFRTPLPYRTCRIKPPYPIGLNFHWLSLYYYLQTKIINTTKLLGSTTNVQPSSLSILTTWLSDYASLLLLSMLSDY